MDTLTLELTTEETKVLLWSLAVLQSAYGQNAPDANYMASARAKLCNELEVSGLNHNPPDFSRDGDMRSTPHPY